MIGTIEICWNTMIDTIFLDVHTFKKKPATILIKKIKQQD